MTSRRSFLKTSALSSGAFALSSLSNTSATAAAASELGPRRFIFIRKSNGIRPKEVALPSFSEDEKEKDNKKQPLEVSLDKHELPQWLQALEPYKQYMAIIQGFSCKMS